LVLNFWRAGSPHPVADAPDIAKGLDALLAAIGPSPLSQNQDR